MPPLGRHHWPLSARRVSSTFWRVSSRITAEQPRRSRPSRPMRSPKITFVMPESYGRNTKATRTARKELIFALLFMFFVLCFYKRPVAQLRQRLLDLGLGVHHERPVGEDRFLEGGAADQHEARGGVAAGFDAHVVAVSEDQH